MANLLYSTTVDGKPIKSLDITIATNGDAPTSPIPRKKKAPKPSSDEATNGSSSKSKGTSAALSNGSGSGVKRSATDALGDDVPSGKKSKQSTEADDDIIILDDADGAICID